MDCDVVENTQIIECFKILIADFPKNTLWREHYDELYPLIVAGVAGFEAATAMEKSGNAHMLEIAHGLRYSIAHVMIYLSIKCVGYAKALEYMPDMWVNLMNERWEDYQLEHGGNNGVHN